MALNAQNFANTAESLRHWLVAHAGAPDGLSAEDTALAVLAKLPKDLHGRFFDQDAFSLDSKKAYGAASTLVWRILPIAEGRTAAGTTDPAWSREDTASALRDLSGALNSTANTIGPLEQALRVLDERLAFERTVMERYGRGVALFHSPPRLRAPTEEVLRLIDGLKPAIDKCAAAISASTTLSNLPGAKWGYADLHDVEDELRQAGFSIDELAELIDDGQQAETRKERMRKRAALRRKQNVT